MIEVIMILSPHLSFKNKNDLEGKGAIVLGRNVEPKAL